MDKKYFHILVLPDCDTWSVVENGNPGYLVRLTEEEFQKLHEHDEISHVIDFNKYANSTASTLIVDNEPVIKG